MSSGTYRIIRDLGLVKGGKGMRHHEVLVTFSLRAFWRWMAGVARDAVVTRKRPGWFQRIPARMSENTSQAVAAPSALRRLPRQ